MAHFVELDPNNTVINGMVISNEVVGETFPESEPIGQDFIANTLKIDGRWIQTSYNANFRGCYAGIGYTYDEESDVFVAPVEEDPSA